MFNKEILGKRIKKVRGKKSQDVFASELGISRGALSFYENGERTPDAEIIYKICELCNISSDYLLGFTDNSTTDPDLKAFCEYTGLSEKSIDILHLWYEADYEEQSDIKNFLIENNHFRNIAMSFFFLLDSSRQYIAFKSINNGESSQELYQELYQKELQCDVDRYNLIKLVEKLSNLFDQRERVQGNGKYYPPEE